MEVCIDGWVIEVEITLFRPYVPAKTWGPVEHCHPEEGGEVDFEILSAEYEEDGPIPALPDDETLEDAVWQQANQEREESWEYYHAN